MRCDPGHLVVRHHGRLQGDRTFLIASRGAKRNTDGSMCAQVGVRILAVPVKPTISDSFSFACPIDASELEVSSDFLHRRRGVGSSRLCFQKLMEAAGISIGDLESLL